MTPIRHRWQALALAGIAVGLRRRRDLPGNNERLFPLALFLFAAGWAVALAAWRSSPTTRFGSPSGTAAFMTALGLALLALALVVYRPLVRRRLR